MRPIDKLVMSVCRVPESEIEAILDVVGTEYNQPSVSKKGVLAWAFLNVYEQSPGLIFAAVFALIFVFPLVIFINLLAYFA